MSSEIFVVIDGMRILIRYFEEVERLRQRTMGILRDILRNLQQELGNLEGIVTAEDFASFAARLETFTQRMNTLRSATPATIAHTVQNLAKDIETFRQDMQRAFRNAVTTRLDTMAQEITGIQEIEPEDRDLLLERIALYRKEVAQNLLSRRDRVLAVFESLKEACQKAQERYRALAAQKETLLREIADLSDTIERGLELLLPKDQEMVRARLEALREGEKTESLAKAVALLERKKTALLQLKERIAEAENRAALHYLVADLSGISEVPERKTREDRMLLERIRILRESMERLGKEWVTADMEALCKDLEEASPTRREAVYGQLVLLYQEALEKRARYLQLVSRLEELKTVLVSLPDGQREAFLARIETLKGKRDITESDVSSLEKEIQKSLHEEIVAQEVLALEQRKTVFQLVRKAVEEEGYTVVGDFLWNAKPMYLRTPWPRYRLKVTANSRGEVLFQIVRIVASEREAQSRSAHEKAQDREIARQWCQHYNRIVARLEELGISVKEHWRKEPEEHDVLVEVHPEMLAEELRQENLRGEKQRHGLRKSN